MQDLPLKLDRLCLADFWKVRNQCDLVVDNPAHGRRVGTKWSLRSPPTKTVSWFYEGNIKMFRKETWILGKVLLFLFFLEDMIAEWSKSFTEVLLTLGTFYYEVTCFCWKGFLLHSDAILILYYLQWILYRWALISELFGFELSCSFG